jgi:hypothetical protein
MPNGTITAGAGYFAERKSVATSFGFGGTENTDAISTYLYTSIRSLLPQSTVDLGLSYDRVEPEIGVVEERQQQLNPKLGVTWAATGRTTIRAATFRVLKRRFLTSQTIEPTQVAGFNQFFDDPDRTDSWLYGAAVDHELTRSALIGIEATKRDLLAPQGGTLDRWRELASRFYLNWAPRPRLSVAAGFEYEKLDREAGSLGPDLFQTVETRITPITVSGFLPNGITARLTMSHVKQDGVFAIAPFFSGLQEGSDAFWITDLMVAYRLPRRAGFISVECRNLFDQTFNFQETDVVFPRFARERLLFLRAHLTL